MPDQLIAILVILAGVNVITNIIGIAAVLTPGETARIGNIFPYIFPSWIYKKTKMNWFGVARKVREAFLFVIHDNGRTVKMIADNTYNRVTLHQKASIVKY